MAKIGREGIDRVSTLALMQTSVIAHPEKALAKGTSVPSCDLSEAILTTTPSSLQRPLRPTTTQNYSHSLPSELLVVTMSSRIQVLCVPARLRCSATRRRRQREHR